MSVVEASVDIPPGWLSDPEADRLAELAKGKTVLELGAWLGRSTVVLASTAHHVVSVDWHKGDEDSGFGDTLPGFWETVRGLDNVSMVVGRFEFVVPLFAPVFQVAFVDGRQDQNAVLRDARMALAVTNGSIAFHDYDRPSVKAAVREIGLRPVRQVDTLAICETLL